MDAGPGSGEEQGEVQGRSRGGSGKVQGRSRGDPGEVQGRSREDPGEVQEDPGRSRGGPGRSGGGPGKVQGRSREGPGKVQGQIRVPAEGGGVDPGLGSAEDPGADPGEDPGEGRGVDPRDGSRKRKLEKTQQGYEHRGDIMWEDTGIHELVSGFDLDGAKQSSTRWGGGVQGQPRKTPVRPWTWRVRLHSM